MGKYGPDCPECGLPPNKSGARWCGCSPESKMMIETWDDPMDMGKIVRFKKDTTLASAAQWCIKHGLHGEIVGEESGLLQIDVGLYYKIYARPDQVQITDITELGSLSPELRHSAPSPECES